MQSSIIIGQLFGPVILIVGLAILINPNIIKYILKIESNNLSLYLESLIRLILGVVIVTFHNSWSSVIEVMISVLGRGILITGIIGLFSPKTIKAIDLPLYQNEIFINARVTLQIILGFLLTYISYLG